MKYKLKIQNSEFKVQPVLLSKFSILNSKGFTLIEAMITITIVGLIGLVLMGILSNGFSGTNKTQLLGNIKQDGQVALNLMENNLKFADDIVCPVPVNDITVPTPKSALVIQDKNGSLKRFYYVAVDGTSNGKIVQDSPTLVSSTAADQYCDTTVVPSNSLTSPSTVTDDSNVSVEALTFTVRKNSGAKPIVEISMDIGPPKTARTVFGESTSPVNFKTKVQLK